MQGPGARDQGPGSDGREPRRVLLCATTTGYQIRSFDEAAAALGIELVLATDRCDHLDDPWRDRAIAVRFHDETPSVAAVVEAVGARGLDGVLAVGDRPVVLAAKVAERLGLPWHDVHCAQVSRDKQRFRDCLWAAGLSAPWSRVLPRDAPPPDDGPFPCVIKPLVLSGSRGVIRADDADSLAAAWARLGRILAAPDVRALRDPAADLIQIEGFVPGVELAIEGVFDHGRLQVLAVFDKPDPLDGPYFEETIYLTPTPRADLLATPAIAAVTQAARAAGLWHGPIHAECRVDGHDVVVLEVAARPIGGLCARALRFEGPAGEPSSLEALLLRAAVGESLDGWRRRPGASGVLMVPIARAGVLRAVRGAEDAERIRHVTGVVVSAKPGQRLDALPEAAGYLGFVFAEAPATAAVEAALRAAGERLEIEVDPAIDVNVG
jgi:hypothetical protein